jgi:hypothetical protein
MAGDVEADIFGRLIDPSNPTLMPQAAEGILSLSYSEADHARMSELAAKSNRRLSHPRNFASLRDMFLLAICFRC